jgi:hypothetical protein
VKLLAVLVDPVLQGKFSNALPANATNSTGTTTSTRTTSTLTTSRARVEVSLASFCKVDGSTRLRGYIGRWYNENQWAALSANGTVFQVGEPQYSNVPRDSGYVDIVSTLNGFSVLHSNGSIYTFGVCKAPNDDEYQWAQSANCWNGQPLYPPGTQYIGIFSNMFAYAAIDYNGRLETWGDPARGGAGAPSGMGWKRVYATSRAMAAVDVDGRIACWGSSISGGAGCPNGTGFHGILYNTMHAFATIKNGEVYVWPTCCGGYGNNGIPNAPGSYGTNGAPNGTDWVSIYTTQSSFCAIDKFGALACWGAFMTPAGCSGQLTCNPPRNDGWIDFVASEHNFAALNVDGSVASWGNPEQYGNGPPSGNNFIQIASNKRGFAALSNEGNIFTWGSQYSGNGLQPNGTVFTKLIGGSDGWFAAMDAQGNLYTFGWDLRGSHPPAGPGWLGAYANRVGWAAYTPNGTVIEWSPYYDSSQYFQGSGYTMYQDFLCQNFTLPDSYTSTSTSTTTSSSTTYVDQIFGRFAN